MASSLSASMQRCSLNSRHAQTATILAPFLQQQTRSASILASLSDVPAAYNKRIRRGRGPSSGKGKTSGRGHKGQKQHGKVPAGFNGGQTPDIVVHGERGFVNQFSLEMTTINLDRIQQWIDQGRLDPSKPITVKELHESRCTHGIKDGLKLLARNSTELRTPIHITVSRASSAAIAAIEAAGGSVQTRYYTRPAIRRILKGQSHPTVSLLSPPQQQQAAAAVAPTSQTSAQAAGELPSMPPGAPTPVADAPPPSTALALGLRPAATYRYRLPDPTSRKDIEYYRDPAHRGYLSYLVGAGQGPSLYFKTPTEMKAILKASRRKNANAAKAGSAGADNKLW